VLSSAIILCVLSDAVNGQQSISPGFSGACGYDVGKGHHDTEGQNMAKNKPAHEAPQLEGKGLVEQLRNAIRASGESLNQLGERCGVGRDRLSRFLRGQRDLTLEAAEKIAEALGLQLTGGRPRKPKEKGKGPGQSLFDPS